MWWLVARPAGWLVLTIAFFAMVVSVAVGQGQRPMCQVAEALVNSVDLHLTEWDNQIEIGLNQSLNCSSFLEFVYLSRDTIRLQLDYIRGNFTAEDAMFKDHGEEGVSTTWAMTHMSTAASLVSAHMHIHGVLAAARRECLSEHLQLLFLMSLRRLKSLTHSQLRHLWVVFQGTAELFRQGAGRWLSELVELFEADLHTMESIMTTWIPPEEDFHKENSTTGECAKEDATCGDSTMDAMTPKRPGPPLPMYSEREPDGIALSTVAVLRRDTFDEWKVGKALLRALLRYVLPRDGHIADLCAGSGQAALFLNDTGLVTAYAFDSSPNIRLLSKGIVDHADIHAASVKLWRSFDIVYCLRSGEDFGRNENAWTQVWQNIEAHTTRGVVLTCGTDEVRQLALGTAARHAPSLQHDVQLSDQLDSLTTGPDGQDGVCVFWRLSTK